MADIFIRYHQSTGLYELIRDGQAEKLGVGWSGCGKGKNNPSMQGVHSVGPLPRGRYTIGKPTTHPTVGPFAMRLTPIEGTDMLGRDGFLIHGPAKDPKDRGNESHGCPILERARREALWSSGARIFEVVE